MTRLPTDRDTHLTRDEITAEALRQFDAGSAEPSIRGLAASLRVAPSAIYHHFPSRAAIVESAVERVWGEATAGLLDLVPDPLEADPRKVLVAIGIASRRAWIVHYRLAPYLAASPAVSEFTGDALGLMSNLFERLGLDADQAGAAFHAYASFMIGAVLFAASRRAADERLHSGDPDDATPAPRPSSHAGERTRQAIGEIAGLAAHDPARDEELFARGLRRLVISLSQPE